MNHFNQTWTVFIDSLEVYSKVEDKSTIGDDLWVEDSDEYLGAGTVTSETATAGTATSATSWTGGYGIEGGSGYGNWSLLQGLGSGSGSGSGSETPTSTAPSKVKTPAKKTSLFQGELGDFENFGMLTDADIKLIEYRESFSNSPFLQCVKKWISTTRGV